LRLKQQAVWNSARVILLLAPLREEIDVWPLLAETLSAGKKVALPRFDPGTNGYVACEIERLEDDLAPGKFGIREPRAHCPPISPSTVELALVPGVAFDLKGRRLGRGKGFYDRLLASVGGRKCGVAFDLQVVEEIPTEPHDVCLDYLLTPTQWLGF
jgi:5-formyltetrahydrofolate cyclo-ligase